MLTVTQAEAIILECVDQLRIERDVEVLNLLDAVGRMLAEPVMSTLDVPHWDNSAMDGYALRYSDVQFCSAANPITLEIVETIPAGCQPQRTIQPGQAARILTGSLMPEGADTVVMQEDTERQGDRVILRTAPKPKAFVRHRATYCRAGDPLLAAGVILQAPEVAVLAAVQCCQVKVYRRLKVAILSTGNELVSIDRPLQPGQIVDSNQYALAALVAQMGAVPVCLGIVPDQPEDLERAIAQAIAADVVLSSGGVSVGDYDYVEEILTRMGATLHIQSVAVKPGKPLTVATVPVSSEDRSVLYFGLPGNPASALVTFWRFVQPALRKLSGLPTWEPPFISAVTQSELRSDGKRETYLWGQLRLVNGHYEFHLAGGSHSSGNLINLAGTTGLAMLPVGQTHIATGDRVQVLQVVIA